MDVGVRMSNIEIEVKNAEMLGRTDNIYTTEFYVMQKQIDELEKENCQTVKSLLEENEELKKELEDKEDYIVKLQATKDRLDRYDYERTIQQQEFIKYLEDMLDDDNDIFSVVRVIDVLQKYKEIIGNDINVGSEGGNKDE